MRVQSGPAGACHSLAIIQRSDIELSEEQDFELAIIHNVDVDHHRNLTYVAELERVGSGTSSLQYSSATFSITSCSLSAANTNVFDRF